MAVSSTQTERKKPDREVQAQAPLSPRDRLLTALAVGPRLNDEDAAHINRIVREAREESLADHVPL